MNPEQILRRYSTSEVEFQRVWEHSRRVEEVALRLAKRLKQRVNIQLLRQGALLHDIGRFKFPSGKHSHLHGFHGGEIMRQEGYPAIARICETHLGAGITKDEAKRLGLPERDFLPSTIEEKLVCYADKLVSGGNEIPFEKAKARFERELGKGVAERLQKLHDEIMGLMRQ